MERETPPEGAAVYRITPRHKLNGSTQHFTDRATGSDTDPDGVNR